MRIEADVSRDGVLTAVRIIIEDEEERSTAQWEAMSTVLDPAEEMDIARRGHQEILDEVRQVRESGEKTGTNHVYCDTVSLPAH